MPSPLGAKVARNPPIFFIDYDVFQLVLQHIQKRKNSGGWPWNDGTSLIDDLSYSDACKRLQKNPFSVYQQYYRTSSFLLDFSKITNLVKF